MCSQNASDQETTKSLIQMSTHADDSIHLIKSAQLLNNRLIPMEAVRVYLIFNTMLLYFGLAVVK